MIRLEVATTFNWSKTMWASAVFINGVGVWVPHVHDDRLNGFSLLGRQLIKKSLQSSDHSAFTNVNDVAGRVL
jgi:hypothetical protein